MNKYLQTAFLFCLIFLLSTSVIFSSEIKKTYEKSFAVSPGGSVAVQTDEGYIKVQSWDKPEVHVVWTKRVWGKTKEDAEKLLELVEVRIIHTENRLQIRVIEPKDQKHLNFWDLLDPDTWSENRRSPIVDFELTVPAEINLTLEADEGDVSVTAVQGEVEIVVDEGDIMVKDLKFKDLCLSTDEGNISGENLTNPTGRISLEVDEGTVFLENVSAKKITLECDEGDATFKKLSCSNCRVSTDEGDIEMEITLNEDDRYEIYTDEGNVVFYLPDNPNVRFDLETQDGRIRSDFDVKIKKRDDFQECRDRLGTGSALIKANTDEGVITLKKF